MKLCTRCGQLVAWEDLAFIGYQDAGDGSWLALHNCACGTTLARETSERPNAESAATDQKVAPAPEL